MLTQEDPETSLKLLYFLGSVNELKLTEFSVIFVLNLIANFKLSKTEFCL